MSNTKPPDPDVVEIDALDEAEWEQGQHTPIAPDKKLEALVRQTAPTPPVAAPLVDPSHGAKSVTYVRTTMRAATIATPAPEPPAPRPTPMPMRAAGEPATPSTSRPVDAPGATAASTAAKLRSVLAKPKPPAVAPALATKKPVTPLPSRVSTSADTFVSADYVDA
ncbi:MAG TPA: hypothetical protein VK427_03605, partial [Kofleriaceae bacterium]|nr:hypothetical protein [Kofleriaceae bacterium]